MILKSKRKSGLSLASLFVLLVANASALGQGGTGRETAAPPPTKKTAPAKKPATAAKRRNQKSKTADQTSNSAAPDTANPAETDLWNSIKDSVNPDDFRSYLQQFPTGQFADRAKTRIHELDSEKAKPAATPTPPATPTPTPQAEENRATLSDTLNWLKEQIDNRATGTGAYLGTKQGRVSMVINNECTIALAEGFRTTTVPLKDLSDFTVRGPAVGNGGFSYVVLDFDTIGTRSTITIDDHTREAQLMGGAWKFFHLSIQFRGDDKELATRVGKAIKHAGKLCREKQPF